MKLYICDKCGIESKEALEDVSILVAENEIQGLDLCSKCEKLWGKILSKTGSNFINAKR